MAAPPALTTSNLTGIYFVNQYLSDDLTDILQAQGVGWLARKAHALASTTLRIVHHPPRRDGSPPPSPSPPSSLPSSPGSFFGSCYMSPPPSDSYGPAERLELHHIHSGALKDALAIRPLDWSERASVEDAVDAGYVRARARRADVYDLGSAFLRMGWTKDVAVHGAIQMVLHGIVQRCGREWVAEQVLGFEMVKGQRRFVRRIDFVGPEGDRIRRRVVYDYFDCS
ncbi:hypothetical protein OF83DRAFT_688169 [Amylostereum chailletii]|nr:hypothetical protein OF83DRAFT_688169 [Amylostereum chailletii]